MPIASSPAAAKPRFNPIAMSLLPFQADPACSPATYVRRATGATASYEAMGSDPSSSAAGRGQAVVIPASAQRVQRESSPELRRSMRERIPAGAPLGGHDQNVSVVKFHA